ncbi:MAG TPA: hypothetical protein VE988_14475 [Gemmataceae bacterium]|nr:hypothetical protein [Gemmataceae bacterium]
MATKPRKPTRRTPRSSAATVAKRVEQVIDLLLCGASIIDLCRFASEQKWGLDRRSVQRYAEKARELLAESLEHDREKLLADHLTRRKSLYARALQIGDYRAALAAARDEALLMGLYPSAKVMHEGDTENPIRARLVIVEEIVNAEPASAGQTEREAA